MTPRRIDDLGSEAPDPRSPYGRLLLTVVVVSAVVLTSLRLEQRVAETLRWTEGSWSLESRDFPSWVPARFTGRLADLHHIPATIPLRSADWRQEVLRSLGENPWIDEVQRVDRTAEGIRFEARLLRPVVGVRCEEGLLLLDSAGRVIDIDRTLDLDPAWGIPLLIPIAGELPALASGTEVRHEEITEALGVLREVWGARLPQRFPGELTLIEAYTEPGVPGLLWRFHDRFGTQLRWGRSPVSPYPPLLPSPARLENLALVLGLGEARREMGAIELFQRTPEVVRRN